MIVEPFAPRAKSWGCVCCLAEPGELHDIECTRWAIALGSRHALIAICHLRAKHTMTRPVEAAVWLAHRDEMIADLQGKSLWDRIIFDAERKRLAERIDHSVRHRARHYHLDDSWSGQGVPPSAVQALRESLSLTYSEAA